MKYFFRTICMIAMLTIYLPTQAQFKLGAKAGLNVCNVNYADFEGFDTKWRPSFHVGATAEYGLSESFALQFGLMYTRKGYTVTVSELTEMEGVPFQADVKIKTNLNYLEIPIQAVYKINKLQIYAGPYVAFGMGGKAKANLSVSSPLVPDVADELGSETTLRPVFGKYDPKDVPENEGVYNALDIGLNVGVGYEFGPVLVNAGYSLGLSKIAPKSIEDQVNPDDKNNHKNSVFTASVSYFFLRR